MEIYKVCEWHDDTLPVTNTTILKHGIELHDAHLNIVAFLF